ncbi:MAG: metallophosphoesterase family protein [Anaerolineae bacterium]|nr:metallophosphoesterase family protein [Anaerolineae bacterium]
MTRKCRIAIIADIHANFEALVAVLDACEAARADLYWCLGDLVGRGDRPLRVLERMFDLVQSNAMNICLSGNHDWLAAGRIKPGTFIAAYENEAPISTTGMQVNVVQAALAHAEMLRDEGCTDLLDWLGARPGAQPVPYLPGYYLAHGYYDPGDELRAVMTYTKVPLSARRQIDRLASEYPKAPPRLVAVGHRHRATLWRSTPGARLPQALDPFAGPYEFNLAEGAVFLVAGSVGVINSFNPHPSFVMLDIESPDEVRITFHRVEEFINADARA